MPFSLMNGSFWKGCLLGEVSCVSPGLSVPLNSHSGVLTGRRVKDALRGAGGSREPEHLQREECPRAWQMVGDHSSLESLSPRRRWTSCSLAAIPSPRPCHPHDQCFSRGFALQRLVSGEREAMASRTCAG